MNSLYVKGLSVLTASGTGGSDPISKFFKYCIGVDSSNKRPD